MSTIISWHYGYYMRLFQESDLFRGQIMLHNATRTALAATLVHFTLWLLTSQIFKLWLGLFLKHVSLDQDARLQMLSSVHRWPMQPWKRFDRNPSVLRLLAFKNCGQSITHSSLTMISVDMWLNDSNNWCAYISGFFPSSLSCSPPSTTSALSRPSSVFIRHIPI